MLSFSCEMILFIIPCSTAAGFPSLRLAHKSIYISSCLHSAARSFVNRDRGTGSLANNI